MRVLFLLALLAVAGCQPTPEAAAQPEPPSGDKPPPGSRDVAPPSDEKPEPADRRPDLKTRKTGSDWASFLGPTHNSVSSETGVRPWSGDGPRVVWERALGNGYGPPAIANGRLFHFDRYGDQARLTCRRSETGGLLWTFGYPSDYEDYFGYSNGPRCAPVVDGEQVYIYGAEGMLHCLNVTDGKLLWKVDTAKDFNVVPNFFGVGAAPLIEGDLLIAIVGGSPVGTDADINKFLERKGNGSGIVAFDKRTGTVKYKFSDEMAAYASPVCATIHNRRWCFAFVRGGLLAFEPVSGKQDFFIPWKARMLESVNAANPVVVGDTVLVTECYDESDKMGGALAVRIKPDLSYEIAWSDVGKSRAKSMQCHWNTPVYHDGYLYGSNGRHTNQAELRCVDWKTGVVKWRKPELTRSSLLLVDGHFLCLTEYGQLILMKATREGFVELSRCHRPGWKYPCWAAPVLSHGLLYIRGERTLSCLELIPGK